MNEFKQIPKEFWDDAEWTEKHYSDLVKRFPDEWVAVVNKKVVSYGESPAQVREDAKMKTGRKNIPITFIECGDHVY